jgi:hypothetical protein
LVAADFSPRHDVAFSLVYKEPGTLIIERNSPEAKRKPNHARIRILDENGLLADENTYLARLEKKNHPLSARASAMICLLIAAAVGQLVWRKSGLNQFIMRFNRSN